VPDPQLVQTGAPEFEYVPARQLTHDDGVAEPNAAEEVPAPQATQTVAPVIDWYIPWAQLTQLDDAELGW
jgi:hypothetical protein